MIALVVPCHRPDLMAGFLAAWRGREWWDRLYVVEDGPARTFDLPAGTVHASHAEIAADLGARAWIISRRDSACRSYGFLRAWRDGAETIATLDTDCTPHDGTCPGEGHRRNLYATPRWTSSVPGLRVRGLPYGDTGALPVYLSVGLWSGVPDLDGVCQLARGVPPDFVPPPGVRVLARGEYVPVCGMNLAFRRDFAPLAYFGLQGEGQPFSRFDDINFGMIAKRIADHLGWGVAVGEPFVRHDRASDPFANLVKEAPGIAAHERLWRFVDALPLTASTPAGCLRDVAAAMPDFDPDPYWARLGRAMVVWTGFFE